MWKPTKPGVLDQTRPTEQQRRSITVQRSLMRQLARVIGMVMLPPRQVRAEREAVGHLAARQKTMAEREARRQLPRTRWVDGAGPAGT